MLRKVDYERVIQEAVQRLKLKGVSNVKVQAVRPVYWRIIDSPTARVGAGFISHSFPTKEAAEEYRRDVLDDAEGKRYTVFAVDEHGRAVDSQQ